MRSNVGGPASTASATPNVPLSAPTGLTATAGRPAELVLSWNYPSDASITEFQVRYRKQLESAGEQDWIWVPGGSGARSETRT